jgi:Fe-S cluster assembly protein SufB
VPYTDNFFATLNSAVFTDGSFCYIPKGVRCPMELSTYFRINAANTGQFERTLIVADEGAHVSYLEGCTAPMRDENQLHAAVVELIALDDAEIKYSTVQNWYPGDENGKGGIYNFVTKRGLCKGKNSKISWTQVETGSAITWKYPSCILQGDNSGGRILFRRRDEQLSAGRHRHEDGPHRQEHAQHDCVEGHFRRARPEQLPRPGQNPEERRERAQFFAVRLAAHRRPVRRAHVPLHRGEKFLARVEHEASTSKIGEDQIFYCNQRGLATQDAVNMIVNGFCKEVFKELPMEFAVEAQKLLGVSLEGSVG